jgi:hypothetical protein
MKKSITFILAAGFLFTLLFSCSSIDDIKLPEKFSVSSSSGVEKPLVNCFIEGKNGEDSQCSRISKELCKEIGADTLGAGEKCPSTGNYPKVPAFTCGWKPDSAYAEKDSATLSLNVPKPDGKCESKAIYRRDSSDFEYLGEKKAIVVGDFNLEILGYLHCKDTIITSTSIKILEGKSEYVLCDSLKMRQAPPVPRPDVSGTFAINNDINFGGERYYSIGSTPSFSTQSFVINNKEEAECSGVNYKITGDTEAAGNVIEAVATATCNGEVKELGKITATVVGPPELSDCVLDSIALLDGTTPIVHEGQTITVEAKLSNSYGRCNEVQYNYGSSSSSRGAGGSSSSRVVGSSSSTRSSSSVVLSSSGTSAFSIPLAGRAGQTLNIGASVVCSGSPPLTKTCTPVPVVVANYKSIPSSEGGCERDKNKFGFKNGRTVLEFACGHEEKGLTDTGDSYYINCNCEGDRCDDSFDVVVEGGATKGDGHNGWNFYPGLPAIAEGNLYRYPVPALVKTKGDLTCGIW